jgi:uncharacterized phage-associated protein
MQIQYQFNLDKAIATMVVFLRRLGPMDKLKLIKLLYLADRDCFLMDGHPITGDTPVAMDHGPVPSACLDVLNGEIASHAFSFLHVRDTEVSLDPNPPGAQTDSFTAEEASVLDNTIQKYGSMSTSDLYRFVHQLPEYKDTHVPGTSTPIGFAKILQHYGSEEQFRHGRPVITRQMRQYLVCPFPQPEPALDA